MLNSSPSFHSMLKYVFLSISCLILPKLQAQTAFELAEKAFERKYEFQEYALAAGDYVQAFRAYLAEADSLSAFDCVREASVSFLKSAQEEEEKELMSEFQKLAKEGISSALADLHRYSLLSMQRNRTTYAKEEEEERKGIEASIDSLYLKITDSSIKSHVAFHEVLHHKSYENYAQADSYLQQALLLDKQYGTLSAVERVKLQMNRLHLSSIYSEISQPIAAKDWVYYLQVARKDIDLVASALQRKYLMKEYHRMNLHRAYALKNFQELEKVLEETEQFWKIQTQGLGTLQGLAGFYNTKGAIYKDVFGRQSRQAGEKEKSISYVKEGLSYFQKALAIYEQIAETYAVLDRPNAIRTAHNIAYTLAEPMGASTSSDTLRYYFYQAYKYVLPLSEWKNFRLESLEIDPSILERGDIQTSELKNILAVLRGLSYAYRRYMEVDKVFDTKHLEKIEGLAVLRRKSLDLLARYSQDQRADRDYQIELAIFYSDMQHTYSILYKETAKRAYADSSIRYIERGVAGETRKKLNKEQLLRSAQVPDAEIASYLTLRKELAKLASQKALALQLKKQKKLESLNRAYSQSMQTLEKLDKELFEKYPKYAQYFREEEPPALEALQASLSAKQVLLVSGESGWRYALSRDSIWLVEYLSGSEPPKVNRVFQILSNYQSFDKEDDKSWYLKWANNQFQRFFPEHKTWQTLGIDELIVLNAGRLQGYPFDFLLTDTTSMEQDMRSYPYLLKSYTLQYLPSLGLWLKEKKRKARAQAYGILGFAPIYGVEYDKKEAGAQGLLRKSLSPLAGAKKELQALQMRYGGTYYFDEQAQEKNFSQLVEQKPHTIIHLAMHGLLNEENPNQSALAFSDSPEPGQDGFLYAHELAQLDIQAELLVLSACETGIGENKISEGPMSLARYAFYAGVPSVVATRWQVNDASTAWIMERFYQYLAEGMPINKALQRAQVDFIEEGPPEAMHPFYWGPYMSMGYADRSISPYMPAWYQSPWLYAALLVLLLALLFFVWKKKRSA